MLIPAKILETLLCGECELYLNVPPIKVYPNRQVKCGRCSEEDDNGVISNMYSTVIKSFKFPCVNLYEGCTDILKFNEVKEHEELCTEGKYKCPLCNNYDCDDTMIAAYKLALHLKASHKKNGLANMEILVQLDHGNYEKIYWICNDQALLIIFLRYDDSENTLSLDTYITGYRNQDSVTQNVTLLTLNDKVEYKANNSLTVWGTVPLDRFHLKINPENYPKNVTICRFSIDNLTSYISPSGCLFDTDSFVIDVRVKCYFKGISKMKDEDEIYCPYEFYVGNLKWRVFIDKSESAGKSYLGIYLLACSNNEQITPNLQVTFNLISADQEKRKSSRLTLPENYIWKKKLGYGIPKFLDFDEVLNKSNKYIKNDSIQFLVRVRYEPQEKEAFQGCEIQCKMCTKKCVLPEVVPLCEDCK